MSLCETAEERVQWADLVKRLMNFGILWGLSLLVSIGFSIRSLLMQLLKCKLK
jgi:hypothetical protein